MKSNGLVSIWFPWSLYWVWVGKGFSFLMIISTYIHTHYGLGSICIFLYVHCVLVFWFQEMDFGLCLLSVRPCRAGFPFLGSFSFFLGKARLGR